MPGTILAAVSNGVFPISLSKKFTESRSVLARWNEYHDGTTQRQSLVGEGRRTWKLAKRLTPSQLVLLRDFWEANRATAFSFYNPFETDPPFTDAPSGTSGLYLVRFASDWEQAVTPGRSDASVELIELANEDFAQFPIPIPPPTPASAPFVSATLTVTTAYTTDAILLPSACVSIYGYSFAFGHGRAIQQNTSWAKRTNNVDVTDTLLDVQLTEPAGIAGLSVSFFIDNGAPGSGSAYLAVFDVYLTALAADGTAQIFTPHATSFDLGSGSGVMIENSDSSLSPQDAFAIDGDVDTYAELHGTSWGPLNNPPLFVVTNFA